MGLAVSVALCTFDSAPYLDPQLRSIAAQTVPPTEVVVSDDGSRDDTLAIVERWAAAAPFPVRVLRNPTARGVTANFEQAVRATRGDLVVLSDHDDVWHPERIAAARARFRDDPDLLLLHTDARLIDEQGLPLGHDLLDSLRVGRGDRALLTDGGAFDALLRRNLVTGATVMLRRRLLDAALPFPPEWVHDEWLAIVASAVGELRLLPEPLIDYRVHGRNQIGVSVPTLRGDAARLLEARGGRYRRLADRDEVLVQRLADLPASDAMRALAERKRDFDEERAAWPVSRLRRLPRVVRRLLVGDYRRLSSRRSLDAIRDLVQSGT